MKKIFLAIALLASLQIASAQVKSYAEAKKGIESAREAADNPKKNTKSSTWIKLGEAYLESYNTSNGGVWTGISEAEVKLVAAKEKVQSSETVTLDGVNYRKDSYPNYDFYFTDNGILAIIKSTNPVYPNALSDALEAYRKANELDAKGKDKTKISEGIQNIAKKFYDEALTEYTLGNIAGASELFEKSAVASSTEPYAQFDTTALYNAGFTAFAQGNNERAKELFRKCIDEYDYVGTEGDVFAKLAAIAEKEGDKQANKNYLETGFERFPQSQGILIGLINYYIAEKEDTGRLFELIGNAKQNEPDNASLYYVEGNIHLQLGHEEEAIASYEQCAKINPEYEFGYIGEGIHFYNKAVEISEKAQAELDDAKYMALVADYEKALKSAIVPFEKAFEITKDAQTKTSISEYLKNAFYRFREESPEMQAGYDKYNKFFTENR